MVLRAVLAGADVVGPDLRRALALVEGALPPGRPRTRLVALLVDVICEAEGSVPQICRVCASPFPFTRAEAHRWAQGVRVPDRCPACRVPQPTG